MSIAGTNKITIQAPSGLNTGFSIVNIDQGSQFQSTSICLGATIFGLNGTAGCLPLHSNAFRNVGSLQLSQAQESVTYAGSTKNPQLPSNYRDVPDINQDDDGLFSPDAGCLSGCTPVVSITWSQHLAMGNCGTSQNSITARVLDCIQENPTLSPWNGAIYGNGGETIWHLVTRNTPIGSCTSTVGSCNLVEVWRDEQTGLIWSADVSVDEWCVASGNSQAVTGCNANGPNPASYCSEVTLSGPSLVPALATEDWTLGIYDLTKGGMGAISTPNQPGVRWRLPTLVDFLQADVDGLNLVMPDRGPILNNVEWSATTSSQFRTQAYTAGLIQLSSFLGPVYLDQGNNDHYHLRCVGR